MSKLEAETARLEAMGRILGEEVTTGFGRGNEAAFLKAADNATLITFGQFKAVMEQRNHDVDELVMLFRGKIDDPRDFFERRSSAFAGVGSLFSGGKSIAAGGAGRRLIETGLRQAILPI